MTEKIESLQRLSELTQAKRSVVCPGGWMPPLRKPKPAAFILNMSGQIILKLIQSGLYVYEPKSTKEIK